MEGMGLMQTVLNQKPSCLLKGGSAFLMGKGRTDPGTGGIEPRAIMWRFMQASVGVPY
jgi:hypothetical protein